MAPVNVGSMYVPDSSTSPIQTVDLNRSGMGAPARLCGHRGHLPGDRSQVYVNVMLRSAGTIRSRSARPAPIVLGTVTITPSFINGMAVVSFVTAPDPAGVPPGSTWPTNQTLASYTMFEPGQSILYVVQNHCSGSGSTSYQRDSADEDLPLWART